MTNFLSRNEELIKLMVSTDQYSPGTALERLEKKYPHVKAQFVSLFGTMKCEVYLKSILFVDRNDGRNGFEPWVFKAIEELLELNALKMRNVKVASKTGVPETGWNTLSKFI